MFRSMVRKSAACSTAACAADDRESDSCDVRTSGPAWAHRQAQLAMLAEWVNELPDANRYWWRVISMTGGKKLIIRKSAGRTG